MATLTEATREKLRLNAETIQSLKQATRHYDNAFRIQMATIDEQTEEIRELRSRIQRYANRFKVMDATASAQATLIRKQGATVDKAFRKLRDQAAMIQEMREENEQFDAQLRERDWTIETYRAKFAVMEDKVDKLTPECTCTEGFVVCTSCGGDNYDCRTCGGSGTEPCPDCGEEMNHD